MFNVTLRQMFVCTRGHGSVVLLQRCNTLCTSGFVDGAIVAHHRSRKNNASRADTQSDPTWAAPERERVVFTIASFFALPALL